MPKADLPTNTSAVRDLEDVKRLIAKMMAVLIDLMNRVDKLENP